MNDYKNALEILNSEYKKLLNSKEYRLGKQILKMKYYLKKFKLKYLIRKFIDSKEKYKVFTESKDANKYLYEGNENNQLNKFDEKGKIVVYTVNIGNYDNLIQPLIKNKKVDFYVISDKKPKELGKWKWLDANKFLVNDKLTNVKKARYLKTHPHLIFPTYKYSIFIDGNIRCVSDISQFISKINKFTKIAIHPHPYRDCIYKEAESCKIMRKGNYETIKKQISEYKNEGMPENFGLFETNVLVREHMAPICINIMEQWWNEIKEKSERDQISFTYILWKNKLIANDIGIICDSIKNNNVVQVIDHLEEYEKEELNDNK